MTGYLEYPARHMNMYVFDTTRNRYLYWRCGIDTECSPHLTVCASEWVLLGKIRRFSAETSPNFVRAVRLSFSQRQTSWLKSLFCRKKAVLHHIFLVSDSETPLGNQLTARDARTREKVFSAAARTSGRTFFCQKLGEKILGLHNTEIES